ncbi:ArsR/SmtB family transcription factor [Ningiella sp. W23]|uniref:ArsR/SmtB family transcription factor n=1 Tax=Ningiella sp. W23 TaxID=3023715 RepID=UPI00375759C0
MKDNKFNETVELLKALGEFNRLSIVYRLCECQTPQNAMCLCDCCSVDASVASRHLKTLAQAGILKSEKKGREKTYVLDRVNVARELRALADKIEAKTCETCVEL